MRSAILNGILPSGSRVDQKMLAEDLGVSLVPIHEALKKLEGEGFVQIIPRRGVFVTETSLRDMEWAYLPELCIMTHGALELTLRVLDGLIVYPENMRRNLHATNGLLLAERIMLALGQHSGRQHAHDVVYEAAMQAFEQGRPFADVLKATPAVAEHLPAAQINDLLDPEDYTRLAAQLVDLDQLLTK